MKQKKFNKKLGFNKQSIARLNNAEMQKEHAGGVRGFPGKSDDCTMSCSCGGGGGNCSVECYPR